MASAGSRALPKMAAGGPARRAGAAAGARGRRRPGTRGSAVPGRRPPGRCAKGSLEGERPVTGSAEPAGEAAPAARCQERGGPGTSSRSSHKVSVRRPSKRLKCEKYSPVKSELEGLTCGSGNLAALGETPKTSDGDQCSEDPGDCNVIKQKKGGSIPDTNEDKQEKEYNVPLKPHAVKSSGAPSKMDSDENLPNHVCSEEESSCESVLSEGSSLEDEDLPKTSIQLDSSAFLDEDSNQPMPVDRFFGDVEFIQDLPAVALPSTTMSRREFRRLHFIAKEDEEEEEEEDVV